MAGVGILAEFPVVTAGEPFVFGEELAGALVAGRFGLW